MTENIEHLRFPAGKFKAPEHITSEQINRWIDEIETLPSKMRAAAERLTDEQLDTPYRPEGWTLRQVIHHVPDSHMNGYIRFKLAATEKNPTIRPYFENLWGECEDARSAPVSVSLNLLEAVHKRWVLFMRTLKPADFERTYVHPEHNKTFTLNAQAGMYAWHGEHHLQHILVTIKNNNWF